MVRQYGRAIKEAEVDLNGTTVKVAVAHGLGNAESWWIK